MTANAMPSVKLLRQLFDLDKETGLLFWKARPANHFRLKRDQVAWNSRNATKPITGITGGGYVRVSINKSRYQAHRIIFKLVTGREPIQQLDHANGIRTDNRWSNLREATHAENLWNHGPHKRNKTGFKGVSASSSWPGHFAADICANGKRKRLGYFNTAEEAHAAYCKAAKKLHAKFANPGAINQ